MILGVDFFGEYNLSPYVTVNPTTLTIKNVQVDQIRVDADSQRDEKISFDKVGWTNKTVMQATYEGKNLESGTVGADGKDITHVLVKRKKADSVNWVTIAKKPISDVTDNVFVFTDKFATPIEKYEYAVIPSNGPTNSTIYNVKEIITEMDSCYIYDKSVRYELYYNFSFGDFKYSMPSEVMETVGGRKYPIVVYNSFIDYARGSVKCLLYSGSEDFNPYEEKKFKNEVLSFLKNRKPKGIKAFNGVNMMIAITGDPSISHQSKGLYTLTFDFVEIGSMDDELDLFNNGFSELPVDGDKPWL